MLYLIRHSRLLTKSWPYGQDFELIKPVQLNQLTTVLKESSSHPYQFATIILGRMRILKTTWCRKSMSPSILNLLAISLLISITQITARSTIDLLRLIKIMF